MLFDTIMHQNVTPIQFSGLRSFADLGQSSHVSCLLTFSKGCTSKNNRPISFKFHMQPFTKGGKKVCIFGPGHMTKMGAMIIYGKNLKNLLLQNHLKLGTRASQ